MNEERRTADDNGDTVRQAEKHRATQQQKHSTVVKNQHWAGKWAIAENAAQIFRATAENWVSSTRRATHTAHSKHKKRSYALFLRFANSNAAAQCYKQHVGRFTASY